LRWSFFFFSSSFFLVYWGLNSGLSTCKAGTLLLEPHLQFKMGFSWTLCLCWPRITSSQSPPSKKLRLYAWTTTPGFKFCWNKYCLTISKLFTWID
jgi:hypothetical protein